MRLIISPASEVRRLCQEARPSHLLRLVSPDLADDTAELHADKIQTLFVHDVGDSAPGRIAPDPDLIRALLDFSGDWSGARPLVAQCWAGVSRSTAAAFVIACQKRPDRSERSLAAALRLAAPQATPNRLMVAHADMLLGRHDRMNAAIREIGRGAEFAAFASAELDLACLGR